ncbi:hypothetical protein RJ639_025799 [Escallonia herrerae]|uniref:BED-type domain-containing protein n=1 Tax=Escallonia herrerae TaxID=1293975 RepID=A0AA88S746_9ASTE|nr:hypothetical protein RJ639_025799 [Escallonia herrerae]
MSTTSEDTLDFEEAHGTRKSEVWSFYIKSPTDEGKVVSECKYCQKVYIAGSSRGTSNMRRHLRSQCPSRNSPEDLALASILQGTDDSTREQMEAFE